MRSITTPLVSVLGLVLLMPGGQPHAQSTPEIRLTVPPGQRLQSASFRLSGGDAWAIRLEAQPGEPQPQVSIYVHAAGGELVGRDDPDEINDVYTWRADGAGEFYLLVQNSGAGAGVVTATRVRGPTDASTGVIVRPVPTAAGRNYAMTRVFFATDRQPITTGAGTFGTEPGSSLQYGYADISIPREHRLGELEGPSILRLEFRNDPDKHIVVLRVQREPVAAFRRGVSTRLASSLRHQALLFVHGFNVSFDNAVRRAAQISYDLAFDGPTVVFSWPSQGGASPLDYRRDERNAQLSADSLRTVILDLLSASPNATVQVIAHSMGNQVLASALEQIAAAGTVTAKLNQVAMIAPDIDAELFRRTAGRIATTSRRVTLYASSEDAALKLSRTFAGYSRAGQRDPDVVVVPGIDTVDASSVDTSILGLNHSYYADNSTILSELFALMRDRPPSERFGLVAVNSARGAYWRFVPAAR